MGRESGFDGFLKEEGIFEHCQEVGMRYAIDMRVRDENEEAKIYSAFLSSHVLEIKQEP